MAAKLSIVVLDGKERSAELKKVLRALDYPSLRHVGLSDELVSLRPDLIPSRPQVTLTVSAPLRGFLSSRKIHVMLDKSMYLVKGTSESDSIKRIKTEIRQALVNREEEWPHVFLTSSEWRATSRAIASDLSDALL